MSGRKNWPKKNFPNIRERYNRVTAMLEFQATHKWFDDDCLKYVITELVESGTVYISERVAEMKLFSIGGYSADAFKGGLSGRKVTENNLKNRKRQGITWEHVIPIKVLMDTIKKEFNSNNLDLDRFKEIVSAAHICIVTLADNDNLEKDKMTDSCNNSVNDPVNDPWARYKKASKKDKEIGIYSLDISRL